MSILDSYNPLKQICLPGAKIDDPQGIVVVVGPNSSGKSLFLQDIDRFLISGKPSFVICESITSQKPSNYEAFVAELIAKSYLKQVNDQQFRTYAPFTELKIHPQDHQRRDFNRSALQEAYDKFDTNANGNNIGWFHNIGTVLVAHLSLDARWRICSKAKDIDFTTATPDYPLQGLKINSEAQAQLAKETGDVFGNAAWLDISQKDSLQLRVADSASPPSIGEANNPQRAVKYSPIENEGDGYRSYVGICLSLLVASRPVSLIDEPELCLHPPQAYHMGRFIGKFSSPDHVTFVATHSSYILRGILETGKNVKVIRLTRQDKEFRGRLIAEKELIDSLKNPKTRGEAILDGIFSKGVVLVESDGDREQYEAAAEAIDDYPAREVQFVPVGGTGGFADPVRFYGILNIPTAIIADLDALFDEEKINTLSTLLSRDSTESQERLRKLHTLVQHLRSVSPPITEEETSSILKTLAEWRLNWEGGDDNRLRTELNSLIGKLKRIHRIKEGGLAAYSDRPDIQSLLNKVISEFNKAGIFFVPVGELEGWVKDLMADYSKNTISKPARAAIAAGLIREAANKTGDIWEFTKSVLDFLTLSKHVKKS